jgi:hypothetical protein|tara:strand:- start:1469 stop:2296 length:828 start_codon:yes stop_codon:yes gene_type:complete
MYLNDLNSASHNVEKINRILSQTFNHNVNLGEMSSDSLNRMLTATTVKIATIKESDLKYWENAQYNKLKLIEHSLKTYIKEVAPARQDGKRAKMKESIVMEQDLDQAEVLLAAKELVDKLQKMIEDVAAMQVQELMPITDAMKDQLGFEVAEQYNSAADAALGGLLDQLKSAKTSLDNATLQASGQPVNGPVPTDMGMGDEFDGDDSDEFDGDDAAAGAPNPVGRELKAEGRLDRMEQSALKEQRFLAAKKRVVESARANGYSEKAIALMMAKIK